MRVSRRIMEEIAVRNLWRVSWSLRLSDRRNGAFYSLLSDGKISHWKVEIGILSVELEFSTDESCRAS